MGKLLLLTTEWAVEVSIISGHTFTSTVDMQGQPLVQVPCGMKMPFCPQKNIDLLMAAPGDVSYMQLHIQSCVMDRV